MSSRKSVLLISAVALALVLIFVATRGPGGGAPPSQEVGGAVPFAVAPLPDKGTLQVDVPVRLSSGEKVQLASLLADRGLVVYLGSDYKNRQDRAATRMIEPLVESGTPLDFRVVVVFPRGTSPKEVARWTEKRRMEAVTTAIDGQGKFAEASGWDLRSAALVDKTGRIGAFFGPSDRWDARTGFDPVLTSDLLALAWRMPDLGPQVSAEQRSAAVEVVRSTLRSDSPASQASLGQAITNPVYVSLFRPGTTSRLRGSASSGALGEALASATRQALDSAGDKKEEWSAAIADIRFQVDLTGTPGPVVSTEEKTLWYLVEPGVHGLIVRNGDEEAVMLPSEPVTRGILTPRVRDRKKKHSKMFRNLCKRVGTGLDAWETGGVEIERFRSTSFGVATPDGPAVPMFRGNVLVEKDLGEAEILESIRLGGQWLVRTVKEDGKFDYEYYPNKDKGSRGYNIVRHAGSVYGLFEMYELAGEEPALAADEDRYIAAAARSMSYVYDALKSPRGDEFGDRVCLLDDRGACDSGSAALTLLTFLSRPAREDVPAKYRAQVFRADDAKLMEGLGLTLIDMIDAQGKVFRRYQQSRRLDAVEKEPLYYPGETMLALMRFYEATEDKRWLEGARRIADRQVARYARKRFRTPDHWVMQAYLPLFQVTGDESYVQSAYAMATHYSSENYEFIWSPWPDYDGSWRRVDDLPRTTRAGSRSEALRAVVELAWSRGDDATLHEDSLLAAARHLAEQQFSERNSYWLPNPDKVLGAYPMGLVDNHCRIDNNQHALVGMVGALNVARRRAGKTD